MGQKLYNMVEDNQEDAFEHLSGITGVRECANETADEMYDLYESTEIYE
jgi:hypothetical protein